MLKKTAFVTDFDGTITGDDFFSYITRRWFDNEALKPWREYLAGQRTHFDALNAMFRQLRVPEEELRGFIRRIPVDPCFEKTVSFCRSKNIPVYITSAGCDYYINILIGNLIEEYALKLITNHGEYSPQTGLSMTPPPASSPYYDKSVGISKAAIVRGLKREGYEVVYAGDGPPDLPPAKAADIVFAKKMLLGLCWEKKINVFAFENFSEIRAYLEEHADV